MRKLWNATGVMIGPVTMTGLGILREEDRMVVLPQCARRVVLPHQEVLITWVLHLICPRRVVLPRQEGLTTWAVHLIWE